MTYACPNSPVLRSVVCVVLLLLASATSMAQGVIGGASPGGVGYGTAPLEQSAFSAGNQSWADAAFGPFRGTVSAGFDYGSQDGVTFSQWNYWGYQPLDIGGEWVSAVFANGRSYTFAESVDTFGWPTAKWSIGGSLGRRVCGSLCIGFNGEVITTRREGEWFTGSVVGIQMSQILGSSVTQLTLNYLYDTAGQNPAIFTNNPSGFEAVAAYSFGPFSSRFGRLNFFCSGYDLNLGDTRERGWLLGTSVTMFGDSLSLTGRAGYDSVTNRYYSVGISISL